MASRSRQVCFQGVATDRGRPRATPTLLGRRKSQRAREFLRATHRDAEEQAHGRLLPRRLQVRRALRLPPLPHGQETIAAAIVTQQDNITLISDIVAPEGRADVFINGLCTKLNIQDTEQTPIFIES